MTTDKRSRVAALLRPTADDTPLIELSAQMTLVEVFRAFWPRLRPLRWWLLLSLGLLVAAPLIAVAEIRLFQSLVDTVLVPADFAPMLWIGAAFIGLNILAAVIDGCDDYLGTWISQKFLTGLRRDTFAHVLALPPHRLDQRRLGDVISRLTSDISTVESFMVSQLTRGVGLLCTLVVYICALFWMQWQLALASMIVIPFFWWAAKRFADYTKTVSRERRRRAGSLTAITEESVGNASLVQGYGAEDRAIADYDRQNIAIMEAELTGSRIRALFLPMVGLLELVGILVVIGLGVWALSTGRLTLGGVLAFLTLLGSCYRPIRGLGDLLPGLFSASAGVERVRELLDEPAVTDPPSARTLPRPVTGISIDNVSARYPGRDRDSISDVDLDIAAGERLAIVGPSGSGKTTIARLLTGTLTASSGTVRLGGHDVTTLTRASIRSAVTTVAQETLLIDATIADNIAFARPGATRDEIEHAARRAGAHEFITELPAGYDTRVGQRARMLSGGQRQRLSLARAFLHGGDLMILDEPTTGLDPRATHHLMSTLARERDRTWVVLTHDPLVLEYVDRVVSLGSVSSSSTPTVDPSMSGVR
ncbi:ABC transporter ATP-binding protein [Gordonia sp. LSe1-13]|uniref:ABC transporter ATP-binding protein n=1 Tax=Gordonia sesuvii TaxID=3116777 RepID=A0ABU7MIU3_9ACTN|nr:ABC transporter ATP-binding protein [Gordonia sp. LSe1-13]